MPIAISISGGIHRQQEKTPLQVATIESPNIPGVAKHTGEDALSVRGKVAKHTGEDALSVRGKVAKHKVTAL